jgi:hypothetical protein
VLAVDLYALIPLAIVVLPIGVGIAVAVVVWRRRQQRRQDLAMWAMQQGLSFSIEDPHGLTTLDFHLFSQGDGRGCENVASGAWEGLDVRVADFWYYEKSGDNDSKTYHRFSIVLASVAAWLPGVRIEKENAFSRLADHLALRDLEFESEEFNRRFEVRADDTEFAYKLIDARMMEWLLHTAGPHCYEVSGPWVLGYCKRLPAAEVPTLLFAVKGFIAQVPRLVWADYGKATS